MAKESTGSIRNALSRLFSSEVIVRSSDGEDVTTADLRNSQSISQDLADGRFKKLYGSGQSHYSSSGYSSSQALHANRFELFQTYEDMDQDPIIASALDIYANEVSTKDAYGQILDVECENGEIKSVLENLVFNILDVNFNARWWARSIAKYGDLFLHMTVNEDVGVTKVTPLSPYEIVRQEDTHGDEIKFVYQGNAHGSAYTTSTQGQIAFEEWEVAHFRFINDGNFFPYGKSIIENGRKIWQQLSLMEEAMLIHRIMRAPEKRVFKIDVGNIEPDAIESYMNDVMADIQQTPLVDPETGQYNLEFNMQNMLEDFFLPVRGNQSGTEINSLQGLQYQAMEDVEYLRKKLMSALKIPNAFLGYEQEIQGKATLAQESIKFSNAVENLQRSIARELKKIAVVHLYVRGYRGSDLIDFNFSFTNPSIVAEQERIEFLSRKVSLARDMREMPFLSDEKIAKEVFNMSEDEIDEEYKEKVRDWKRNFRKDQIEREGNDPVKTGMSYGTPSDLAMSGSSQIQNLDIDDTEDQLNDLDKEEGENDLGSGDDDVSGMKDLSNQIRNKSSDVTHNYQGGSPMALSSSLEKHFNRKKRLIQETYMESDDEEEKRNEEHMKDTYMDESTLEEKSDRLKEILDKTL